MQRGMFQMQQPVRIAVAAARPSAIPVQACDGAGRVEEDKTLSVKIPAGVDNGDRIRLAGEGEAGPAGTPPGDLYVEVRVRPHAIFERDGDDLHCDVPIRISQAALGDTVRVPTLGGEVEMRIPAETQTGRVFRLRDKGVKSVRSRAPGDLYCKAVVETPGQPDRGTARPAGTIREDLRWRRGPSALAQGQHLPGWREGILGPDGLLSASLQTIAIPTGMSKHDAHQQHVTNFDLVCMVPKYPFRSSHVVLPPRRSIQHKTQ